jgi:hypothetical protein
MEHVYSHINFKDIWVWDNYIVATCDYEGAYVIYFPSKKEEEYDV